MNTLTLRHYGASPGSHAHPHFQVLLGLEGELELEVAGKAQRVLAGGGCVIAPGERHDFEARSGSHCLVLDSTQTAWASCKSAAPRPDSALALATYLRLALKHQQHWTIQNAASLLLDCWQIPPQSTLSRGRKIDWQALTDWAETRLHQPLTVADIASQVFLSPTQFATRCRGETGFSPMQWLRKLRLARAFTLRAGGLDTALTAKRCGYQSASALVHAMRTEAAQQTII
ncbi:MAG: AraC family transcriptional regulator [Pseudomonadota bacterium]